MQHPPRDWSIGRSRFDVGRSPTRESDGAALRLTRPPRRLARESFDHHLVKPVEPRAIDRLLHALSQDVEISSAGIVRQWQSDPPSDR